MSDTQKLHQIVAIFLKKIAAAQNEVALSYHRILGLYFLAVVFTATITVISRVNI